MANNTVAFYTIYIILSYIATISTKETNYVLGGKGLFEYFTRDEP